LTLISTLYYLETVNFKDKLCIGQFSLWHDFFLSIASLLSVRQHIQLQKKRIGLGVIRSCATCLHWGVVSVGLHIKSTHSLAHTFWPGCIFCSPRTSGRPSQRRNYVIWE